MGLRTIVKPTTATLWASTPFKCFLSGPYPVLTHWENFCHAKIVMICKLCHESLWGLKPVTTLSVCKCVSDHWLPDTKMFIFTHHSVVNHDTESDISLAGASFHLCVLRCVLAGCHFFSHCRLPLFSYFQLFRSPVYYFAMAKEVN